MKVNELFKQRSITACMRASYYAMTADPKSFVKQTWCPSPYCWLSCSTFSSPTSRFTTGEK